MQLTPSTTTKSHALIFGASGINGWAVVNALLNDYPTRDTFSRITALSNRQLDPDRVLWPVSGKLQHVSGLDLLQGSQIDLENQLKERVPDVGSVTVVYFLAYYQHPQPEIEIEVNTRLLERAVTAVEHLSGSLRSVVMAIGVKTYGFHLSDKFPWKDRLPLREDLPRLPEPHASQLFYYNQLDLLQTLSANKRWTYCVAIPDVIIGFVPNNNFYGLAQNLAVYLSLYREIHGEGAEVVFPGTKKAWVNLCNDSSQDIIARFMIHASLRPELSAGQMFNTADSATPSTWEVKWPVICDYFGLKGVAPSEDENVGPDPDLFVIENRDTWVEMERKYGLKGRLVKGNEKMVTGSSQFLLNMPDFDRHLDLGKMHRVWGDAVEEADVKGAWYVAFDRYRKAKMIP